MTDRELDHGRARSLVILLLPWTVVFIMLFLRLGDLPLIAPDEGRNAEVAREMFDDGAWLVPTYDGIAYLDKPAFFFKAAALAYSALGVSEFSARLPSALFGLGLLGAVFWFARREYGRQTAGLAVLVLATTPLYMAFSRLVIFDMTLAFFVCSSIFCGYAAETGPEAQRRRWHLAAAALGAIATLVKGPVGFIIPLLVILVFCRVDGRRGAWRRVFAPAHWLVFLAIVAPWFFGLVAQHPDFAYYGVVKESLSRFGTAEFKRTQPFYYYGLIVASCVFPWSLLLPESAWRAWKSRSRWSSADRLLLVWVIVVIAFFSVSQSKLPGYILSAVVALGILLARVLAQALNGVDLRSGGLVLRAALALAAVSAAAAAFLLGPLADDWLPTALRLNPDQWSAYATSLRSLGFSLTAVAVLSLAGCILRHPPSAAAAFLAVPLALMTVNFDVLSTFMESRSTRSLARALAPQLPEGTEVACLQCLPVGLPFYLRKYVTVVTDDAREFTSNYILYTLATGNLRSGQVVRQQDVRQWLKEREHPVYLLAEPGSRPQLEAIAQRRKGTVVQLSSRYWGALLPAPETQALN